MSPQIVHEEEYTFKTDIWSLGCLFFELLTGNTPFQSKSMKQLSKHMSLGTFMLTLSDRPSMETIYILASCLLYNEAERISTASLAEHPYLNLNHPLTPLNPQDQSGFSLSPSKIKSKIQNRLSKLSNEAQLSTLVNFQTNSEQSLYEITLNINNPKIANSFGAYLTS